MAVPACKAQCFCKAAEYEPRVDRTQEDQVDEGGEVEFRCESPSVGQNVSHFEAALKEEECPNHPFKSVAWI